MWRSAYEPFRVAEIPEIVDLNVLPAWRRRGLGTALLDAAETTIAARLLIAGIGCGLYADYAAAMRLYVVRGYMPDGRGVVYQGKPVRAEDLIRIDDSATLMFTKPMAVAGATMPRGRRSARAILLDDQDRLVLVKRTRPGQAPYWTTPGGGVQETDSSLVAALHRELAEELAAEAAVVSQVFFNSSPTDSGVVQHVFLARLITLNEPARRGPEFTDPSRGAYELDRIELYGNDLATIDLRPAALKEFILANRDALLAEAPLRVGRRRAGVAG